MSQHFFTFRIITCIPLYETSLLETIRRNLACPHPRQYGLQRENSVGRLCHRGHRDSPNTGHRISAQAGSSKRVHSQYESYAAFYIFVKDLFVLVDIPLKPISTSIAYGPATTHSSGYPPGFRISGAMPMHWHQPSLVWVKYSIWVQVSYMTSEDIYDPPSAREVNLDCVCKDPVV